jgi:hypothetical protein
MDATISTLDLKRKLDREDPVKVVETLAPNAIAKPTSPAH